MHLVEVLTEELPSKGQTVGVLTINTDNCNQNAAGGINQADQLLHAIQDANTVAHAGLIAAKSPNSPPFNYFFHPSNSARNMQAAINMAENPASIQSIINSYTIETPLIFIKL